MKKLFIICLISFISFMTANAQIQEKKAVKNKSIYYDVGLVLIPLGGLSTLNYELPLRVGQKINWYLRTGFGSYSRVLSNVSHPTVLSGVTMLTGKKNGHFELNGGAIVFEDTSSTVVYPLLDMNYRFQKPQSGFMFKVKLGLLGLGLGFGIAF